MSEHWNEARVEQLKALWNDGLSASQIARVLGGITRNAVIGKIHRLGLAGRAQPPRRTASKTRVYAHRPTLETLHVPSATPIIEPEAVTLESGARVTIANVANGQCRWPHGDPQNAAEFHLCGNPTAVQSVYCTAHTRKAYAAGHIRPRRDEATEELAAIARAERIFA